MLIDFCKADCRDILGVVSAKFLPIRVPRNILEEVDQLTEAEAQGLGIEILEVTMQQIEEASMRGGPSRQDRLCFVVARDNNGAVWSNDQKLHKLCDANKVTVFWGLEMLLELVRLNHLTKARATQAGQRIHQVDSHYITTAILDEFKRKLAGL
ncbi:MAG: hypothetical protein KA248_00665 [Kiritimatiellae bacterium]|nr:hypothetical protein [Kiritimatiellia bacterium]